MLSMIDIYKNHGRRGGRAQVLSNVSLDVTAGEIVGVVGSLRDGSTALLHIAAGRIQPDEGRVMFGGINITGLSRGKRDRLMTPQTLWVDRKSPERTVRWHVSLTLIAERHGMPEVNRLVSQGLERMGVSECASYYLSGLSNWERLLVEFARVVTTRRRLILADGLLDDLNGPQRKEARRLLQSLVDELGCGILLRASDLQSAWVADRVWNFARGELTLVSDKMPLNVVALPTDSRDSFGRQRFSTPVSDVTFSERISVRVDDRQTISRFWGIAITMHFEENQPPHFHVRSGSRGEP
jgi:ABC-type lipoprotein export system ATPase subunit